jgi:cell division protein FtsB
MTPQEAKTIIDLLRDTVSIQTELIRRATYEINQLKLQVVEDNATIVELLNEKNELIEDNCVLKERIHELRDQINDLKSGLDLIDPHGVLRSECP